MQKKAACKSCAKTELQSELDTPPPLSGMGARLYRQRECVSPVAHTQAELPEKRRSPI